MSDPVRPRPPVAKRKPGGKPAALSREQPMRLSSCQLWAVSITHGAGCARPSDTRPRLAPELNSVTSQNPNAAQATTIGHVILTGDFNARIASESDMPERPPPLHILPTVRGCSDVSKNTSGQLFLVTHVLPTTLPS
jgi:hypothetical protein